MAVATPLYKSKAAVVNLLMVSSLISFSH